MKRFSWIFRAGLFVGLLLLFAGEGWGDRALKVTTYTVRETGQQVQAVEGELLVKFKPGLTRTAATEVHRALSATTLKTLNQIYTDLVALPAGMSLQEGIAAYQSRPEVEYAEPNLIRHLCLTPNDPYFKDQDHLTLIKAEAGWDIFTGSSDVVIAILDNGTQLDHEDLAGNLWTNPGEIPGNGKDDDRNGYIDDVHGYDFYARDSDPSPGEESPAAARSLSPLSPGSQTSSTLQQFNPLGTVSHGTHVAGLAAAVGNNAKGVTGVSWKAAIMVCRVAAADGGIPLDAEVEGILYAASNGAKVANMGFAGPVGSATEAAAIKFALDADVVLVAAAGNDNADLSISPVFPACYDGVVAVASTNAQDQKSDFSNYGSRVDICAPGGNGVPFLGLLSTAYYDPANPKLGPAYGLMAGTSMASSVTAGAVALIRGLNPALSRQEVVAALTGGADNIDSTNPAYVGKLGAGRLDVPQSLALAKPIPKIQILHPTPNSVSYSTTPTVVGLVQRTSAKAPAVDPGTVAISVDGTPRFSGATDAGYNADTGQLEVTLPPLTQGAHTLLVQASDAKGNAANPVSVNFRVDTYIVEAGVRMVSVPHLLTRTDPPAVLGEASPQVARWEPAGGTDPGVGTYHQWASGTIDPFVQALKPGKAYWVQNSQDSPLRVEGGSVPFANFVFTEEYQASAADPLRIGWHQIGTPFPFSISAGSILFEKQGQTLPASQAVAAGWVGPDLFWYTSQGYQWASLDEALMEPFVGYWIETLAPCRITMPPVGTRQSGVGRSSWPEGGWKARLTVKAGGYVDAANVFGVAPGALDGEDVWDVEKPPSLGVWGEFRLPTGRSYAQDIRSEAGGDKGWDFQVGNSLPNATATLLWDDLKSVPKDVILVLTDLDANKQVLMRTSGGYQFQAGPAGGVRHFRIRAQKAEGGLSLVGPVRVEASRATAVSISVNLSQPAFASVKILSLSGVVLRQVVKGEAVDAGATTFYWDGRDEAGVRLPAGNYVCEIVVDTEQGEEVHGTTTFIMLR